MQIRDRLFLFSLIVHQALNNVREYGLEGQEAVLESVRTRVRPVHPPVCLHCCRLLSLQVRAVNSIADWEASSWGAGHLHRVYAVCDTSIAVIFHPSREAAATTWIIRIDMTLSLQH
jgi:hypothetical protein